ncbi:MAG: 2-C-methyl-D-erythritol 2,4-cyclodiphosphate synthase [Bacteroidales bacterium]|nr:2-C-methyl-D-erythritol 2,4-cyclodiphosphate synthase [Bacteroidales bacterium]MDD4671144.1 2-C-methyl-D-erythritol 2,4-cyclodiphosphate synthase [Bacteroidales bacterium]
MKIRIGNGYDVHELAFGIPLTLGGVRIDHNKGCIAHSDGDVMLHSLCDAMLGALALGDIGLHFPDTSDEFLGIDSKILLKRVNEMIKSKGYELVNADMTVLLQRPKISSYIPDMRKTIANVLNIDIERISIKATTTEKLGFVGKEMGIASYSTVLLQTKE